MANRGSRANWHHDEIMRAVEAYFQMFRMDMAGIKFNKNAKYREVAAIINRTAPSVSMKMSNISAVLVKLGWPYLKGLKPMSNYQGDLEIAVAEYISSVDDSDFLLSAQAGVASSLNSPVSIDFHANPHVHLGPLLENRNTNVLAAKRDYAGLEARNSELGLAGELLILENERRTLFDLGYKELSTKVEHVSKTQGDGLGYDIRSYDKNGNLRLIEVKTSRYSALTPFHITENEIRTSEKNRSNYELHRIYDYLRFEQGKQKSIQAYKIKGDMRENLALSAANYLALPA